MKSASLLALITALALALGGCGSDHSTPTDRSAGQPTNPYPEPGEKAPGDTSPESPAQNRQDVATAEQQAVETRAQNEHATAVAAAESAHRVEVEKCHALSGADQTDCIARADAALERAKALAKQKLEERSPPPG
jgi:hypothetical protein